MSSATDRVVFGNRRLGPFNLIYAGLGKYTAYFNPEFLSKPEPGQSPNKAGRHATVADGCQPLAVTLYTSASGSLGPEYPILLRSVRL